MKFGIVFLVLGLSIGGLGLVSTTLLTDNVEATSLDEREDAAYQEGVALEEWLTQNENQVATTADAPVTDSGDVAAIDSYLENVYYDLSEARVNALYVDTESGEILTGIGTDAETVEELEFPETDELNEDLSTNLVQQTEPYATPDETGTETDEQAVVSYYVGVDGGDGALVFSFDLADRSTGMVSAADSGTVVTVVDEQGQIVGDDAYLGGSIDDAGQTFLMEYEDTNGVLEASQEEARGSIRVDDPPGETLQNEPYNFDPEGYVAGYYTTNDGWTVLVHTDEADALGLANSATQFGLLITFAGVALIGLFGTILGRNTARSLSDLSERATSIRDGAYDTTVESSRIDEIGVLYDSFDDMRGSLVETIDEAETAREDAEHERERVARINRQLERTADEYSDVMEAAADGDLTARMDADSD
ncbi:methyl-accepting chemotaxis sensory transducer, partial [Natrialba magadii ATCC 43099]